MPEIEGVDFVVVNTDAQALNNSIADNRIQLGPDMTRALAPVPAPKRAWAAAEETLEDIERALELARSMRFIAAGMGGGTGTGAAPVIAEAGAAQGRADRGCGDQAVPVRRHAPRARSRKRDRPNCRSTVDTLIVILQSEPVPQSPRLRPTFKEAFQLADEVLQQGVRSITDLDGHARSHQPRLCRRRSVVMGVDGQGDDGRRPGRRP